MNNERYFVPQTRARLKNTKSIKQQKKMRVILHVKQKNEKESEPEKIQKLPLLCATINGKMVKDFAPQTMQIIKCILLF